MRSKTKIDTREAWSHTHDFPIEEVGNTNKAIARLIVPHLQAFNLTSTLIGRYYFGSSDISSDERKNI